MADWLKTFIYFKMAYWWLSLFVKLAACTSITTKISETTLPIYLKLGIQNNLKPTGDTHVQKNFIDSKQLIGSHIGSEKIDPKA